MKMLPDGVQFQATCLSKQSMASRPVAPFIFPASPNLCPKHTVNSYITRTESFRDAGQEKRSKLLLSYIKTHNAITSSSVARWILSMLNLAGVDTNQFKAHSTRSASISAAASARVTTNQIMEAAEWSSESVFQQFYYRPQSNVVSVAVLSTEPATNLLKTSCWYVIWAFWSVITWMAQVTEWLPAILDYIRKKLHPKNSLVIITTWKTTHRSIGTTLTMPTSWYILISKN